MFEAMLNFVLAIYYLFKCLKAKIKFKPNYGKSVKPREIFKTLEYCKIKYILINKLNNKQTIDDIRFIFEEM